MKSAAEVFHHDQLVNWSQDLAEALLPWLKDFDSYDDKLQFFDAIHRELASIGETAFELAKSTDK